MYCIQCLIDHSPLVTISTTQWAAKMRLVHWWEISWSIYIHPQMADLFYYVSCNIFKSLSRLYPFIFWPVNSTSQQPSNIIAKLCTLMKQLLRRGFVPAHSYRHTSVFHPCTSSGTAAAAQFLHYTPPPPPRNYDQID